MNGKMILPSAGKLAASMSLLVFITRDSGRISKYCTDLNEAERHREEYLVNDISGGCRII
jgi:hypothetical protein